MAAWVGPVHMDAGLAAIEEPRNLALDGEGLAGAVAAVQDREFPVGLCEDCRDELIAVHDDRRIHIDGIEVAFPMIEGVTRRRRTEEPHYLTVGIAGHARRRVGDPLSIDYNGQEPVDFPEDGRDATVVIHGHADSGPARIENPFQVALPVLEGPAGLRDGLDEGKPTVLVVMHAGRRIRGTAAHGVNHQVVSAQHEIGEDGLVAVHRDHVERVVAGCVA